jgi:hypothetical protein
MWWARFLLRKLQALLACVAFGTLYGATCGAIYVSIVTTRDGGPVGSAMSIGGCWGAVMGCVSGAIGWMIGRPLGWSFAGAVGGLAPFVIVWITLGPPTSFAWFDFWIMGVPVLIGVVVGRAVDLGLRKGQSRLPGVPQLAKVLNDARTPARIAHARGVPAEVMPANTPAGRGDEATPAELALRQDN